MPDAQGLYSDTFDLPSSYGAGDTTSVEQVVAVPQPGEATAFSSNLESNWDSKVQYKVVVIVLAALGGLYALHRAGIRSIAVA